MIARLEGFLWVALLVGAAWLGVALYDRFTERGRLSAAYARALAKYGEGSPEADAARVALLEHWRRLDRC